jgi:hypothetical protein
MKTYLYTHANAVSIQQSSFLRKSLFLLFSTLIAFAAFAGGNGQADPQNPEFKLPLVLKNFNVIINNKKINLDWTTGYEKDLSYFIVERSTNGVDYTQAGVVFAAGNSTAVQKYSFSDVVSTASKGVIYYRLKMIDSQKRYQNSPVRLVRMDETNAEVKVQAYPNPVVNELRITVPATWQNKQVSYEVYNMNGNVVKRITTGNASQTETINVQELGAGNYVVKAYTLNESASERIVKK